MSASDPHNKPPPESAPVAMSIPDEKQPIKRKVEHKSVKLKVEDNLAQSIDDIKRPAGLKCFFTNISDPMIGHRASFEWPLLFGPTLKRTQPDVSELVRVSCKKVTQNSRYIDVNHDALASYALDFCFDEIDNYDNNINEFQSVLHSQANLSERDKINMTCLFVILQFGSGFTPMLEQYHTGHDNVHIIGAGIAAIHKKYGSLSTKTLQSLTDDEIAELFKIPHKKSTSDMLHKVIGKMVRILSLKQCDDFTDYVYYCIDLAWIKSQTKDLSAIKTFEWELNNQMKIGLSFAPTRSQVVRRCVVTAFKPTNDDPDNAHNNAICEDLVRRRAFLYAINDQIVYNKPFAEVISTIRSYLSESADDDCKLYNVAGKRMVALQFGMHLDREPQTMQTLLFNFVNDFSVLNDQHIYRDFYGANKHLKVYLFQCVQALIMELYYNVFVTAPADERNPVFDFKGINSLTAVVDNVIPFVLLQDGIIKIKDEFADEFNKYIDGPFVLKTSSDLEIEIIASTVAAIEMMLQQRKNKNDLNIAKLVYALRNKGKMIKYNRFQGSHSRGANEQSK